MSARLHALLLVLLFCVAGFFATYHLTESPPVWYDEGFYIQSAANLATYSQMGLRIEPGVIEPPSKLITVGYPLIYPLAGWFKVFGISVLSARSLMVLFILGFLFSSYLLARCLFNKDIALGVLALLVTLPTLYGNGKSVLGEVPGLMYLVLFLVCFAFARSSATKKYLWLILSGLLAGLCVATKPTFLLLLPAIAVGAFIEWKRNTFNIKELSVAVFVGFVPIVYWLVTQFRTGDSLYYIFSDYVNPYQIQDMFQIILINIGRLFTDAGPLYLTVILCIWAVALWIRQRRQEKIPTEEIIVLVFSLLTVASYVRTAGWYRYLFEAQALSLIFFPSALFIVAKSIIPNMGKIIVSAAVIILTALGAYQILFNSFVAESYNSHKTAFLEKYFSTDPSSASFFFYDVPEVASFDHSGNYYQYISPSGWPIGKEELVIIEKGIVDNIVARPNAYEGGKDTIFKLYTVEQTTHDYVFLKRNK